MARSMSVILIPTAFNIGNITDINGKAYILSSDPVNSFKR